MTCESIDSLADELFAAFERNDVAALLGRCFAPDAVLSKNGMRSGELVDLLPTYATLRDRIGQHRYSAVRREVFDHGFVEEHRVDTVLPSGEPLIVFACVIGRIDADGRICELAEYVGAPVSAPVSAAASWTPARP